jgi:hypothetical protein
MYLIGGEYVGSYSNNPSILAPTSGEDDFGLDRYEPLFAHPFPQWLENGEFGVSLLFDQAYDKDIFYFCHVSATLTNLCFLTICSLTISILFTSRHRFMSL